MKLKRARGQALVLFALTLLLLALMVLLTVSLGMRVREKMELQTLADVAAYSDAVATARTYNVMAVMNRTEWSLVVAQAATQGYISWASAYYDALLGLNRKAAPLMAAELALCQPPPRIPPAVARFNQWKQKLQREIQRVERVWDGVDRTASRQVRTINSISAGMNEPDFYRNYLTLEGLIRGQRLAGKVVDKAQAASPWPLEAPADATNTVNMREISRDCSRGAACDPMPGRGAVGSNNIIHQYEITMGSRGDAFSTGRAGGALVITARINTVLAGFGAALYTGGGSAYRSDQYDSPRHGREANPGAAQSDDEGSVNYFGMFASCPALGLANVTTQVLANLASNRDTHKWSNGTCRNQRDTSHSLIGDIAGGNWPIVIDYNENKLSNPQDLHGQPKLYSLLTRDYSAGRGGAKAPFFLNFKFNLGSRAETFDNRGQKAGEGGRYDIHLQSAMATGLAYYHRGGDWREPPNFMNPFWRATLVTPDIDAQGKGRSGDIPKTLDAAGLSAAKQTFEALERENFEGWQ